MRSSNKCRGEGGGMPAHAAYRHRLCVPPPASRFRVPSAVDIVQRISTTPYKLILRILYNP